MGNVSYRYGDDLYFDVYPNVDAIRVMPLVVFLDDIAGHLAFEGNGCVREGTVRTKAGGMAGVILAGCQRRGFASILLAVVATEVRPRLVTNVGPFAVESLEYRHVHADTDGARFGPTCHEGTTDTGVNDVTFYTDLTIEVSGPRSLWTRPDQHVLTAIVVKPEELAGPQVETAGWIGLALGIDPVVHCGHAGLAQE